MTNKKDNEEFEKSTKCWICDNVYINSDVKVTNHCHVTKKHRGSADKDWNIKVKSQNSCWIPEFKKLRFLFY